MRATPMTRMLPLISAIWLLAFFAAVPRAQQAPPPGQGSTPPLPGVRAVPAPTNQHPESLFTPSENCVACHNVLMTPSGEDVSIGASWRSTMMANSGRDPYWQGGARRETARHTTGRE